MILFRRNLINFKRYNYKVPCRFSSSGSSTQSSFITYLRGLKWTPIPIGLGFAYLAYQQYGQIKKREIRKIEGGSNVSKSATDLEIGLIKLIPLKQMSRMAGWLSEKELPMWIRQHFFSWYIKKYACDMSEALEPDHMKYSTFEQFFGRDLKRDARVVDASASITCPSDGTCLHYGEIKGNMVEQVKGVTYSLQQFLGPTSWQSESNNNNADFPSCLLSNKHNVLYHCIIYLNPGNYHKFHSPTDWTVLYRRHFSGELLSTMPSFVEWIKGLYSLNERVVCAGQWRHGFFALVPVGATNVGSIKLNFDQELVTNKSKTDGATHDLDYRKVNSNGVAMSKGEAFGEFKLGSTIVLIFEGPKDLKFNIRPNQTLKFGQPLAS